MEHSTEPIPEYSSPTKTARNPYLVPISIIIAGALVAGAVLLSKKPETPPAVQNVPEGNIQTLREITGKDHYLGDIRTAQVAIVEYSDPECPFCKQFHGTMREIMEDKELKGKIAWVYRHFPIDSLHSKARNEAEAMECATELGGNDAFWKYTNRLYEVTPANNGLDPRELPRIAQEIGLNPAAFAECLSAGKYQDKIQADFENAIETGGNGTPWSLVVSKSGKVTPINGSASFTETRAILVKALQ